MAVIKWLYDLEKFGMKLGLDRISLLLRALDNPHLSFPCVHIAGTNGKGTVAHLMGNILQEEGYKTGVYTSPHLQEFSERITINNIPITPRDIKWHANKVKTVMEKNNITATFFEVVTALALDYFHHQDVTFAVIETGLGGRLDATNIIEPAVSIITNITYEHNEILGNTLEKITGEKAGIIKQAPVITAAVEPALSVIKKVASQRGASVSVIGEDVTWQSITPHHFCISTKKKYDVTTGMIGEFQGENIALALAASEQLNISKKAILKGIRKTKPPGRMEIISHDPLILLDGAHNPAAMGKLKNTLVQNFHFHHLIFVLGILKDKDIPNMISHLLDIGDYFIVTTSSNPRSCPPNILTKILQKEIAKQKTIITNKNLSCALKTAMDLAKTNDLICVTGSLFTVGEARNFFAHIFK